MYIIGGKHKKRRLVTPKSAEVRPSASQLREALFNICQQSIEGAQFLDLFAGSGGIGLEALSRGAKGSTFVENNRSSLISLRKNIETLHEEENARILSFDVFEALKRLDKENRKFDIIFADPPYGTKEHSLSNQVLEAIASSSLLSKEGMLFLEDALEASSQDVSLGGTLELVSVRRYGRAALRHYRHS